MSGTPDDLGRDEDMGEEVDPGTAPCGCPRHPVAPAVSLLGKGRGEVGTRGRCRQGSSEAGVRARSISTWSRMGGGSPLSRSGAMLSVTYSKPSLSSWVGRRPPTLGIPGPLSSVWLKLGMGSPSRP